MLLQRKRLVVVYQRTSCPCGVTSKPSGEPCVRVACVCMPALSAGGWGVCKFAACAKKKKKAFNIDYFNQAMWGSTEGETGGLACGCVGSVY